MWGYGVVVVAVLSAGGVVELSEPSVVVPELDAVDPSDVVVAAGGFMFVFISSDGGVLVVEEAVVPDESLESVELALDTDPSVVDEAVSSVLVLVVDPPASVDVPVSVDVEVGSVRTGPMIAD